MNVSCDKPIPTNQKRAVRYGTQIIVLALITTFFIQHNAMSVEKKFTNRLTHEKSPYLLQHADNPVDWYPWGEEAFARAAKEDKPVFLSIGYSTCHWCHVMEHESFEDQAIAKIINENFIAVKVDREERPDIDGVYMAAVMSMTGRGGWPLTVVLTPDKKPFFGGTYFPPVAKWGAPGLVDVLHSLTENWQNNRHGIQASSENITQVVMQGVAKSGSEEMLDASVLERAFNQYRQHFDEEYGGFGMEPKFPSSHNMSFLLRYWYRTGDKEALEMVDATLTQMARGGMYDHIRGGFHRYATDRYWQIPHFEKMLYDQAMLAWTYTEMYQITKNPEYMRVVDEIFSYVLEDMTGAEGGFYSAEDADSLDPDEYAAMSVDTKQSLHKKEGAFYLWRYDEIQTILTDEEFDVFAAYYAIKKDGNAHTDPHQEFTGKNIIFTERSLQQTAKLKNKVVDEVDQMLKSANQKLLKVRNERPRPHLDDKVLVDWNGLMIGSLAYGGKVMNQAKYIDAAEKAAAFIIKEMIKDGRLYHRYRDGSVDVTGTIEDYAFFIHGLLGLYEVTFNIDYLERARDLTEIMIDLFWDEREGGFYFTADDAEKLIFRQKEIYDGAIPSGNSIAALDLIRLAHITLDPKYDQYLQRLFTTFSDALNKHPIGYAQMLSVFDFAVGPAAEIVLTEGKNPEFLARSHQTLFAAFIPNKVIVRRNKDKQDLNRVVAIAPFVKEQEPVENQSTIYVCENHVCKLPVVDEEGFHKVIQPLLKQTQ